MKRIVILALFLAGCTAPAPVTTKVKMPPSPSGLVVRQAPKAAVARTVAAAVVTYKAPFPLGMHIVPRSTAPMATAPRYRLIPLPVTGPHCFQKLIIPGAGFYTWYDGLQNGWWYVAQTNAMLGKSTWVNVGFPMQFTGSTNDVFGVGMAMPPTDFQRLAGWPTKP